MAGNVFKSDMKFQSESQKLENSFSLQFKDCYPSTSYEVMRFINISLLFTDFKTKIYKKSSKSKVNKSSKL